MYYCSETNPAYGQGKDLNSGLPDLKSVPLTTWPCCLPGMMRGRDIKGSVKGRCKTKVDLTIYYGRLYGGEKQRSSDKTI